VSLDAELDAAVRAIADVRARVPRERSALVAVTGIDGCGKSVISPRVASRIEAHGLRVARLAVDDWLDLPHVRFDRSCPAEGFYRRAIRFEELFARLVDPLVASRSISIEVDAARETATEFHRRRFDYSDVDVVLLEGIYLLKRELRSRYDFSIWIECSFETALARAVARAQEGLSPDETERQYRTVYFPAQEIHFERDDPRRAASLVIVNDERFGRSELEP
jgi:uridine kinase